MERTSTGDTWRARPALAAGLRLLIMLVPIWASLAVTAVLRLLVPSPHGPWWFGWAFGLLMCALLVAVAVEHAARRLLPLVTLLKLSMLFPDQAPTRFSIARTAGSVRKLEARLAEAQDDTAAREENRTAATILSLSVALQTHDRRTRGHAERVRVFTDLLGEELQLSEDDRYRLRWAALMHDIGKLTISPKILNKPGALDEREWRLMKGHPTEGASIAEPILGWLGAWGDAIVEHHERFDGKGYPSGLVGGAISLGGRIVSVADSYDTMTAARSYKKPMAVWAARRELADCAGGQFDPEMVRAFLSISLPKLLWRTGPVSLFVQLPFLGRLQQVGLQSVTAMTQGVAAATVAAGVTAMVVAGPTGASAHGHHRGPDHGGPNTAGAVAVPSRTDPAPGPGGAPPAPRAPTPEPTTPTARAPRGIPPRNRFQRPRRRPSRRSPAHLHRLRPHVPHPRPPRRHVRCRRPLRCRCLPCLRFRSRARRPCRSHPFHPSRSPHCLRFRSPRSLLSRYRDRSRCSPSLRPTLRTEHRPASGCRYRSASLVVKVDVADGAATIEGGQRALHAVDLRR